jgi:hypothetical protein
MGRTVPSFRMLLEEIILELSVFKRALRGEDKIAFDNLMNKAREHSSSCTVTPMLEPMDAVFLSILVEQQKEISSLKEAINAGNRITYGLLMLLPLPKKHRCDSRGVGVISARLVIFHLSDIHIH